MSIFMTLFFVVQVIAILSFVPNHRNDNYILKTFTHSIENFAPEQSEKLQYFFGTIMFPLLYTFLYYRLSKINLKISMKSYKIVSILILICIILGSIYIFKCNPFYLNTIVSYTSPQASIILAIAFSINLIIYSKIIYKKNIQKILNNIWITLGIFLTIYCSKFLLTNNYLYYGTDAHASAYLYPIVRVAYGQTLGIDFNNIYGFYPYLINPIIQLFGGVVTQYRLSMLMSFFYCISILSVTITIFIVCKNKIIGFLGSAALNFIALFMVPLFPAGEYYLQYVPHRILFPMLSLLYCTIYLKLNEKNICKKNYFMRIFALILCTLSLMWNLESGIICIAMIITTFFYISFTKYEWFKRSFWREIISSTLLILCSIFVFLILIVFITFCRSNQIINPFDLMFGPLIFYNYGFYMIPMPLLHPWILLVLFYIVSLCNSINNIFIIQKQKLYMFDLKNALKFLLPILGMGIFVYYQGRSHPYCFHPIVWPSIILICIYLQEFSDKIIEQSKQKNRYNVIKMATFFTAACSIIMLLAINLGVILMRSDILPILKSSSANFDEYNSNIIELYKNKIKEDSPIYIISVNTTLTYVEVGETNIPSVPETLDWYIKEDIFNALINYLDISESNIIFDTTYLEFIIDNIDNNFGDYLLLNYTLEEIIGEDGEIMYYKRK